MRKFVFRALPAAMLLLSGCSLMPSLERITAPVAAMWPKSAPAAGQLPVAGVSWQQVLPDPRLQALVDAALTHNRDLRIAVARVEEARALYGVSRADRLPTLNLGTSQSASHLPADLASSGRETVSRRYDVNLGLTAFELDFWGRVRSLSESARASYLASEEAQAAFRLSLIADVATAYLALLDFDERLQLAQATLANRQQSRDLVQKRRDVGLAGDLDFLTADAACESARVQVIDLERSRAQAENALTLLVGQMPENLPPARSLAELQLRLDLGVAVPSEALANRPDVRAAEQRLLAANANIGAARAAFLPRVGISFAYGTASRALDGLFESGSRAWSFTPSLTLPLFDFGRTRANVDLAEARKVIAVAEYEKTLQQAFREIADLLVARDRLAEQLQAQAALEKRQSERLRLVEARHQAGASSYLEVLDAQRDANAASQGTVQVHRALLSTAAQLYKALGGSGSAS